MRSRRSRLSDVTYGHFNDVLRALGFETGRTPEGFHAYLHRPADTFITVPAGNDDELMPLRHLVPNVTLMDLRDVAPREKVERLLHRQRVA